MKKFCVPVHMLNSEEKLALAQELKKRGMYFSGEGYDFAEHSINFFAINATVHPRGHLTHGYNNQEHYEGWHVLTIGRSLCR